MFGFLFVFVLSSFFQSVDYSAIFSKDYRKAVNFIDQNSELFLYYSSEFQTDPEIIMSVVFPEAIRYSIISDYLETKSLEITYVYSGSADFSIGCFQMKPSFIEDIEETILKYPEKLSNYDTLVISGKFSESEIRQKRLSHLKILDYQIVYTNCLCDIMKILYPEIFNYDKPFQIKFISTAFNHGFLSGLEEISDYSSRPFFPLNGKNNTPKYVYSDISFFFYQNDLPMIVSKKK